LAGFHPTLIGRFCPTPEDWDTEAVQQAIHGGAQVLVPPDGAATLKARQPRQMTNNPVAQRMRAELATEAGRALYHMRQAIVEPVIGYIKAVRGFRRFALRGPNCVRAEWRIICTTHNLLKLFRYLCVANIGPSLFGTFTTNLRIHRARGFLAGISVNTGRPQN
jgi:hypothetical protein